MFLFSQISYGAASSVFSKKQNYPSFLRTVHPNKDVIEVIVNIILHFKWSWVAFLNIDDDYGNDGRDLFIKMIKDTEICLGYTKGLQHDSDYSSIFRQIQAQKIGVIVVFAAEWTAEALIKSAIQLNITNKVWIAGDAWSLNKELPKEKGIKNIGTVLGVAEPVVEIPGFSDFVHSAKSKNHCENTEQELL
ncbi:Taste receptor type 1 member 1 [Nibea albiflora]|uniref:Taste receptor type 1 member 1 n=1 Tax=Nibea albiflora TaxID=240163 RepID=A0ACB7EKQ0_NIBAL|nr:Taste receptor type 1 member 1 [Nibea albiflora]